MARGYLALVLHAHLPFVRHPEHETFLEESWLFEAVTETYVPLLRVFEGLVRDGVPFRLTVSLSPTLVTMLRDEFLQRRYLAHLDKLCQLAESEVHRTRGDSRLGPIARFYQGFFGQTRELFDHHYQRDLVAAFGRLEHAGVLDLITTGATHGYLPLLRTEPSAVRAQLKVAADAHRRAFGTAAGGVWLPECGYYPGLEALVKEAGFRYFVVDTHGLANASPRPRRGVSAPVACPNGVSAFGRDADSSRQVWSHEQGYPGDPLYREFYRDIGFDLDFDYVRPYILDEHTRIQTGIKYYRITGAGSSKEPYDPQAAQARAGAHAEDFVARRLETVQSLGASLDRPPLVTAPYDAELFGHWWFEGPVWLDQVIRQVAAHGEQLSLVTPSDYLDYHPMLQVVTPSASSWGEHGYNQFWLNEGNAWIYPHLHEAARLMHAAARDFGTEPAGGTVHRALQQAARSLLLAQASDWAFIMKTGSAVEYAHRRVRDHLARFHYLEQCLRAGRVDPHRLNALEVMDNIFPDLDVRAYA